MSQAPPSAGQATAQDRLLLVGNPNVGKSVIFHLLTGAYVTVSNYPGTTVEVSRGHLKGNPQVLVLDTPGANDLSPDSEDEAVTRDIIYEQPAQGVINVLDAKNLTRGLALTLRLAEMGLPLVVALNMMDEAALAGIEVNERRLSEALGADVVPTVAVERRGIGRLLSLARHAAHASLRIAYDPRVQEAVAQLEPLMPAAHVSARALALAVLADEHGIYECLARLGAPHEAQIRDVAQTAQHGRSQPLRYIIARERRQAVDDLVASTVTRRAVSASRLRECTSWACVHPVWGVLVLLAVLAGLYVVVGRFAAGTCVGFLEHRVFGSPEVVLLDWPASGGSWRIRDVGPRPRGAELLTPPSSAPRLAPGLQYEITVGGPGLADTVMAVQVEPGDRRLAPRTVALAPTLAAEGGTPRLAARFAVAAPAHWRLVWSQSQPGAPLRGPDRIVLRQLARGLISPAVARGVQRLAGRGLVYDLLVGQYGLVTMGLTYALAIVLPIVGFFFLAFAVLEDSGYLPRLAAMANRSFTAVGLNGKAVLPMVLGLGCVTMATLAGRILDTPKQRLIATLLLALGIPCSAQLGVVMALTSAIGWPAVLTVFGVVALQLVVVGIIANRLIPGGAAPLIMELPPMRWPRLGNVLLKTVHRVEWFLREAVPFFLAATLLLFVVDRLGALRWLERATSPVLSGLLSLPGEATQAFLVGFVRRDYGAAGLYALRSEGRLDNVQTVVAMIVITLFVPCVANFLIIVKEQGLRRAVGLGGLVLAIALGTGAAANVAIRGLGLRF